jgi:hypothetical protein
MIWVSLVMGDASNPEDRPVNPLLEAALVLGTWAAVIGLAYLSRRLRRRPRRVITVLDEGPAVFTAGPIDFAGAGPPPFDHPLALDHPEAGQ